jgi:hypothetical protein
MRQAALERVTIFTGTRAAIRRMASAEPGPGQMYVTMARKHIRHYGGPDRVSSSRSAGDQRIQVSQVTRRTMSGPSSRGRSRTHTAWNGYRPERDQSQAGDLGEEVERSPLLG